MSDLSYPATAATTPYPFSATKKFPFGSPMTSAANGNAEYHRELIEYNPQRIKSVGSLLREALLRDNDAADTYAAIQERARSVDDR